MNIRLWSLVHKWTSLACTIFLFLLCLTGLPLIFHEEIDHLSGEVEALDLPAGTADASMDRVVESARAKQPDKVVRYLFWEPKDHPNLTLASMASSMDAPMDEAWYVAMDSRTTDVLDEPNEKGFMYVMLKLHTDMFAGLPGMLFLGFMGLLFVIAIVSGIVLYKPFTRRIDFGAVRRRRPLIKWLDLHNLLGIVTIAWALVVGITGSINTLSTILLAVWQGDQMADMIAPYKDAPPLKTPGSVQTAIEAARAAVPDMEVSFVAFPGSAFSSPHHYTVFLKGTTPVTARLLRPALIDAETGLLTDTREMPWYIKALLLSQPLHFGDYGGLPLKIVWALLDILTLIILGSGIYLWLKKRGGRRQDLLEESAETLS